MIREILRSRPWWVWVLETLAFVGLLFVGYLAVVIVFGAMA